MSNHGGDRVGPYAATKFGSAQRIDEILTALAHAQRRRILHYLDDENPASRREVARQVAAWERDTTPTAVSKEVVRTTEMQFHHAHLPRLQDVQLVEYDRGSERLLCRDFPELVEHCLENCAPTDLPS
jgi:DNA-binding transcriptional ArsR family regulator